MSQSYSVESGRESLSGLGQCLAAVLERPEGHSIGTFASLVGRLHAELAMIGDQRAEPEDGEVLFEDFVQAMEDARPGC